MATQTITVSGMTCDHCVKSVKDELTKIEGVTDVEVTLSSGAVTITSEHPVELEAVTAAVDEAGYEVAT